jgi:hypothetical protein
MGLFANSTTTPWINILNKYSSQGINILTNPSAAPEIDLSAYKNAFNYMANRIRNVDGASNVEFVYHPVRGYGDTVNLYPGDQYADWIGFSVFNNDVCMDVKNADGSITANGTGTLDSNLAQGLAWAQSKGKKIMIAESAFQTPSTGMTTANFETYLSRVLSLINTYDVRSWTYIDSNWTAHQWTLPWGDSRIEANPTVLAWWKGQLGSRFLQY